MLDLWSFRADCCGDAKPRKRRYAFNLFFATDAVEVDSSVVMVRHRGTVTEGGTSLGRSGIRFGENTLRKCVQRHLSLRYLDLAKTAKCLFTSSPIPDRNSIH